MKLVFRGAIKQQTCGQYSEGPCCTFGVLWDILCEPSGLVWWCRWGFTRWARVPKRVFMRSPSKIPPKFNGKTRPLPPLPPHPQWENKWNFGRREGKKNKFRPSGRGGGEGRRSASSAPCLFPPHLLHGTLEALFSEALCRTPSQWSWPFHLGHIC